MWRRVRRRLTGRQTLNRHDIVGHPGVPEFNRRHRDAPLSATGSLILWTVLAILALGFVALIVFTR
jgi:hypothetical protein